MAKRLARCPTCTAHMECPSSEDLAIDMARLRTQLQILQDTVDRMAQSVKFSPSQSLHSTEDQEAKPSISRVKYTISRIDKAGKRLETPGNSPSPSKPTKSEPEFAFEAREVFDDKGKCTAQIVLTSQSLREVVYRVLKRQFEHKKDIKWAEKEPSLSALKAPFTLLLSYWRELTKEAHLLETDDTKREGHEDLKILLRHVRDLQPDLVLQIESLQDATRIAREHLEIVFRPGTLVVAQPHLDQPQIFKVHSVSIEDDDHDDNDDNDDKDDNKDNVVIKCWAYDWKGAQLARVYYNFKIKNFGDEKEIKDLPCYPLRYYEEENGNKGLEALKNKLITRGKLFRKICAKEPGAKSMCLYKGATVEMRSRRMYPGFPRAKIEWAIRESLVSKQKNHSVALSTNRAQISEPIMVDFESFRQECLELLPIGKTLLPSPNVNPCNCPLCLDIGDQRWITGFSETIVEAEDGAERGLDRNYLLLPSRVLGYAFKTGRFAQFFVDKVETLTDEHPGQEFDKSLIFPEDKEENKNDIKRLILGHKSDEGDRTIGDRPLISDAVEGKGKGLVILLHGTWKRPSPLSA